MPHIVVMEYTGTGVKEEKALQEKIARIPQVKAVSSSTASQC